MRALFDVNHPAHVHLFKHAAEELSAAGHEIHIASRVKDVTTDLLDAEGFEHTPLSERGGGGPGLVGEWMAREVRLLRLARRFDPDVVVSMLNPAAAHVSWLLGVPNVVFNDTEQTRLVDRVTIPFASVVCTPARFERDLGATQRRYDGFHELAYLHPDRFERDPDVLREAGVDPDQPYAVFRFVAMDAHHDAGHRSLSTDEKRSLIERVEDRMPVYVSSEGALPPDLADRELPVPPEDLHQLLAHADLYAGDSGTMATEAALLATPSVRLNPYDEEFGNFRELHEHGLITTCRESAAFVETVLELADDPEAGERWERRRRKLLDEKVDVTAHIVDLVTDAAAT
ncbi:DUF354 domain-containing protein [Halorarum halobium]|uniref:DUF354 domain-containing protein n=1 Tax=Halorarum halobium TaxID=3075121 RepID=UPI0028A82654|nr:DUF354 domain-containing protein [Halobaculum sp. XH14]